MSRWSHLLIFLSNMFFFFACGILFHSSVGAFAAITTFIAITFPFFGGLLGFFGGFALAPTTYYLPCIIWLIVRKPERWSITWCINWICIVIGVLLMILAPIGGLRLIIKSVGSYQFYS
ncbi:putative amino acid transporter, transmembrane domain-containing protein [Helianthus debilis subsp. tardiflorus]